MTIDRAREYTVIVNGGSGCFFQPADPEATYILTAKHNIANAGNQITDLTHFQYQNDHWEILTIPFENLETGVNYFPHPNKDIAIVKIQRLAGLDFCFRLDDLDFDRNGFSLLGYPKVRRDEYPDDKPKWYRPDEGISILDTLPGLLRGAHVPGNPSYEELVGQSGGGIVKIDGDKLKLAGIINKIPTQSEQLGRIEFTPVHVFNEIIELHKNQLAPLLPSHLSSFEFLRQKAFELNLDRFQRENLGTVLSFLRLKAKEIVDSDLTPAIIKDKLNKGLLVDENDVDNLSDMQVWQAWLELLTVLNIARNEKCSLENLEEDFDLYRLKYLSTTDDWTEHFHSIQYADYKGLKTGEGKVFVKTSGDTSPSGLLDLPEHMVVDITRDFNFELLKTDSGSHPFKDFKFYHIDYLKKKCIRDNEGSLKGLSEQEDILNALRDEYSKLFG